MTGRLVRVSEAGKVTLTSVPDAETYFKFDKGVLVTNYLKHGLCANGKFGPKGSGVTLNLVSKGNTDES